ncbi:hypothetical protein GQ43DRAFT_158251 [Delitschia confertaspora ATCC 74209]|uniref:Uncharacterized protein n=1 Tax=Delitschia confertaspora ATCC 74209 TaxID=1513339 RepID=A0A9P4MWK3_9PLEO|nr:hypothetical protein GQ43DRAFT_158251 [Delitschia confertaspora ATCC 74209]
MRLDVFDMYNLNPKPGSSPPPKFSLFAEVDFMLRPIMQSFTSIMKAALCPLGSTLFWDIFGRQRDRTLSQLTMSGAGFIMGYRTNDWAVEYIPDREERRIREQNAIQSPAHFAFSILSPFSESRAPLSMDIFLPGRKANTYQGLLELPSYQKSKPPPYVCPRSDTSV